MLLKLIKLRFLAMFSRTADKKKKRGMGAFAGYAILILYVAACFGYIFYMMFDMMASVLAPVEPFRWFYFALVSVMACGLSFFFTAFTAKSELFEAKDNELLLSMPLTPRKILLSRMSVIVIMELLISLLVFGTAGIVWFSMVPPTALSVGLYVLGALLLPLLSAALASLAGWLLARLTARARNQTLVTVLSTLVYLGIYFYVYFSAQTHLQSLLLNFEAAAQGFGGWGFLFCWFGKGVADGNLLLFLCVALICLAAIALALYFTSKGFLKVTSAKNQKRNKVRAVELRSSSVRSALLRRELKRFTGSAVYMINSGLGLLFSVIGSVVLLIKMDDVRGLLERLTGMGFAMTKTELAMVLAVGLSLISSMDEITSPSVSLEGKNLWIVQAAPIPTKLILWAKIKLHCLLCCPAAAVLSLVVAFIAQLELLGWVILLAVPLLNVVMVAAFGLTVNLLMPKLDWTNETLAVKQSGAVLVTTLGTMGFFTMAIVLFFIVGWQNIALYFLVFTAISAVLTTVCLCWIPTHGVKRFQKL